MALPEPFHVVLVEPEIPPNTGTISRLCGATDSVLHLVKPLGFNTDDRHLKRAGLDYWRFVRIVYWDSFWEFLQANDTGRMHFLSKKAAAPFTECRFRPGDFLVFGKETKGLPEEILWQFPERCYAIPMSNPNIRSLNISVAAGIVLYEALRQQAEAAGGWEGFAPLRKP
ncbi:MAG: tRNA (cytidine(34)-2'-O)-methyltransferase [Desulfobacteraceae bacterium]|nr:tRNA (cytidine(34)-2'-O)-methyltransferase [Desulfobacteraceae bacterium]